MEKFVVFANKPRLLQRFRERLAEYKRYWEGVQVIFRFNNGVLIKIPWPRSACIIPDVAHARIFPRKTFYCVGIAACFCFCFCFFALPPTAAGSVLSWSMAFLSSSFYPVPPGVFALYDVNPTSLSLSLRSARFSLQNVPCFLFVQTVCCLYVCGQRKCGQIGIPTVNSPPGTPPSGGVRGGGGIREPSYDGSFNASSQRTNSQSSTGSQGAAETGAKPPMGGLGDVGGWANVDMGMGGAP